MINKKISTALIYPLLISLVAFTVVIALLLFVVPQIVTVFDSMNQILPPLTVVIIELSNFLTTYIEIIIVSIIAIVIGLKIATKQKIFKISRSFPEDIDNCKIWFDETVQRLNLDQRGELVGEFRPTDRLLLVNQRGLVKTVIPEITMHFDEDLIVMEKWEPKKPITAIHWAGEKDLFYVKRFLIDTPEKEDNVLTDDSNSYLETVFTDYRPKAELVFTKERGKDRKEKLIIDLEEFIGLKGIGALGNQLTKYKILEINSLESYPYELPKTIATASIEVIDEQPVKTTQQEDGVISQEVNTVEPLPLPKDTGKDQEPPINDDGQALLF